MKWFEEHGFEKFGQNGWKRNIGGVSIIVKNESEDGWISYLLDSISGICNAGKGSSPSSAINEALSNTKEVLSRLHMTFLAIESVFRNDISYDEAWKEISQGGE